MLSIFASLLVLAALYWCPFWRRDRHFLPLYFWAIYCGLGPVSAFGIAPLSLRWPMGCAFGAVGLWWFARSRRRTVDSMVTMPALLVACALASTVYSEVPQYSLLRAIALTPMFMGTFLGARMLIKEPGGINRVASCLILMIGIQAALQIGSWFFGGTGAILQGRFQGVHRATGTAHQLAYALPFATLWIARTVGWARAATIAATALAAYLLVLTRSRTGLLGGAIVAPLAYFAILRHTRGVQLAQCMAGFAMLGAMLWIALANDSTLVFLRMSSTEELLNTRVGRWDAIVAELWDSPWIGHGYGAVRYFEVDGAMTWTLDGRLSGHTNTHNEYLSLLYDLGIVPMLMFTAFIAAIGWRGAAALFSRTSAQSDLLIAVFLSWFVDALDTITHDGLMTIGNPAAIWFWIKSLILFYGCPMLMHTPSLGVLAATSSKDARRQQHAPA